MRAQELLGLGRRRRRLLPFTAHMIELEPGVWSMEHGDDPMASIRTEAVLEHAGGLGGKRVIDLGCLEGGYAAAFARHGAAEAVGVEARRLNFERCELVRSSLGLENLRFERADVREVSAASHGRFDVVFAAGILYHLDDPFALVETIAGMCDGIAVIDTHVAEDHSGHCPERTVRSHRGRDYEGGILFEYEAGAAQRQIESSLWASYGNPSSFWLRKEDLVSLLGELGFASVTQVPTPRPYFCSLDCGSECRVLLVASRR